MKQLAYVALVLGSSLAALACSRSSAPGGTATATSTALAAPAPSALASSAAAAPSEAAAGAAAPPASALAAVFGPPGPIRVEGYSRIVYTGMNDPAYAAGFTADGEYLGYCAELGARTPASTHCTLLPRAGAPLVLESDVKDEYDAKAQRALDAWVKEHHLPTLPGGAPDKPSAPELRGDWAFARDLVVVLDPTAQSKRGAAIRLGGRVGSEKPVYPLLFDQAPAGKDLPFHTAWVNALVLSPDATELGLVAGFFCMEWCDAFESHRISVTRFASQIFNDTGMRHHTAHDYAGSASLFEKATQADPSHAIAFYNLACADARLQREGTRAALEAAIRVGGATVKARAQKDADFDLVRAQPWFAGVVAP